MYKSLTEIEQQQNLNVDDILHWSNELRTKFVDVSDEVIEEFEHFIQKYKKKYSSIREHFNRFVIFAKNLEETRQIQKEINNTVFGITIFSDRTIEELKKVKLHFCPNCLF